MALSVTINPFKSFYFNSK